MQSYSQFAAQMTPEALARADALIQEVHEPWMDEPLNLIDRSLPSDVERFKIIPLTPEQEAFLQADLACGENEIRTPEGSCSNCGDPQE